MQGDGHASDNASHLKQFKELDKQPGPDRPVGLSPFRSGQPVEGGHNGFSGIDSVFPEFQLQGYLDQATDQDHPEGNEHGYGSQGGCGNKFSRTYDGYRQDKARPKMAELSGNWQGRYSRE